MPHYSLIPFNNTLALHLQQCVSGQAASKGELRIRVRNVNVRVSEAEWATAIEANPARLTFFFLVSASWNE